VKRYAARRDANEPELVMLARQIGAVMWPLAEPVDWLVGWRGRWYPTELKNPEGRNRLTEQQILFSAAAKERELPVWIWRSEDDVFRDLGARRTA
jgi:hypothetical protein